MWRAIKNGWKETFSFLGGWGWLYSLLIIPIIGFVLHWLIAGADAMRPELKIWLVYGLAAACLAFMGLLIVNIAAAPYRLERERADLLEAKCNAVQKEIDTLRAAGIAARRQLSAEQKAAFARHLRDSGNLQVNELNVLYREVSEECSDFAEDIVDALAIAGTRGIRTKNVFNDDPKERGIIIRVPQPSELPTDAKLLKDAFLKVGYQIETKPLGDEASQEISIYIGKAKT